MNPIVGKHWVKRTSVRDDAWEVGGVVIHFDEHGFRMFIRGFHYLNSDGDICDVSGGTVSIPTVQIAEEVDEAISLYLLKQSVSVR